MKNVTNVLGNEMCGAVFSGFNSSGEAKYRYSLWRFWNYPAFRDGKAKAVMFIMANPSTAAAHKDDPTVRRCTLLANSWGFDGIYVGNLMAVIDTHWAPIDGTNNAEQYGPDNNEWLIEMRDKARIHIAAWGFMGSYAKERAEEVRKLFPKLYHLGLSKRQKFPLHPLYLSPGVKPILWEG